MAAPEEREFSIRIVCMDYYMAPPLPDMDVCYNSFQGQAVAEVPIIRIYGPTLSWQKTCLHVHGSFPYFYVPYGNDLPQNLQDGYNFLHTFASAIEKAMKLNNDVCAKRQHIHSCSLVRAKKFYGYQPSEQLFIKIVLYYPHETGHVAALLMSGGLFNHAFQPFESHIPYLLQFMIDHNLYGMGHIHLSKVKFRNPIPDAILDRRSMFNDTVSEHFQGTKCCLNANMAHLQTQTAVDKNIWLMSNVPSEWLWPVYSFAYVEDTPLSNAQLLKQSICELEGDAFVGDILNQKRLVYSSLSQTGPEVRMVQSLTPIYEELSSMSVSHSKPEKHENLRPSAATVLKTLSHEEHESIILDHFPNHDFRRETLCASSHDAEESKVLQSCQPHKESSRSPTNYDVPSCERPPDVNSEMLSSTQPANEKDCPTHRHDTSQTMQEPTALDAVIDEGVIKSQMSQCPETKDSEGEIVELLRWLSSSQAADGIDVEDGELEENLVSQVLHSNSLEKALEKAKLDYENASQKECEDILYCSKAVEESKCKDEIMPQNQLSENITPEQCHLLIRSNVSIPQLDGCWDEMDRLSEFSSVQRKKKHRKAKSASSSESSKEEQSSAHAVWGSLPLAECEIQNHSAREPCSSSSKDACSFSELSRSSEKEEADLNVESGKNVNGQSLRDLMRKKTCLEA